MLEALAFCALVALVVVREVGTHRSHRELVALMRHRDELAAREREQLLQRIQDPVAAVATHASQPEHHEPRRLHRGEGDERTELAELIDGELRARGALEL